MQVKFYKEAVAMAVCNTDYESEIKDKGDKVHIRQIPDVTMRDYEKGGTLIVETPDISPLEFTIDYADYFNIALDDVDKVQSDLPLLDQWTKEASYQMKQRVDIRVLQSVYSEAHASNVGLTAGADTGAFNMGTAGTPFPLDETNILHKFVDMNTILAEQSVPDEGRWVIIPPIVANRIKKSDLKDASMTGDSVSPIRNGMIGRIDNLTIYQSRNLFSVLDGGRLSFYILFGTKHAITFANQIVKTQRIATPESTFAQLVRGLNVYGFKVIKPEALGALYCYMA